MPRKNSHDLVYHVTTQDRAEQCLVDGIIPYKTSECNDVTRVQDADFDAKRPDAVVERGVSRSTAVYAHPEFQHALDRHNGGWLARVETKLAVIAISVPDPTGVYVCDAYLTNPTSSAEEYWQSLMTLADYRAQDKPMFTVPHAKYPKQFHYMWPEVLLPGGVPPDNVLIHRL